MNQERLHQLSARAERAKQLASQITELTEADPFRSGARITFKDYNTNDDYLAGDLLKRVVGEGRLKVLADMEAELEGLLGTDPEPLADNGESDNAK